MKQFGKGISIKKYIAAKNISSSSDFYQRRQRRTINCRAVLRVLPPPPWNEEPRCVDLFVGPFRGPDGANTTETDCAARTGRVWGQIKNQFERTTLIRKCSTGCFSSPGACNWTVLGAKSSNQTADQTPSSRRKYFLYTNGVLRGGLIRVGDSIKNLFEFET